MDERKQDFPLTVSSLQRKTVSVDVQKPAISQNSPSKTEILQDLNEHLAVHAERMRLLNRAEEGLVSDSFSPYSGRHSSPGDNKEVSSKNINDDKETNTSKIPVLSKRQKRREKENLSKPTMKPDLMKTTTLEIHPVQERVAQKADKPSHPVPEKVAQKADKQQSRKGVPRGKKSGVQIKNYRADYTWNRGGRLKELRIRHLARKFSKLWKNKTFGRVLPSVARRHYETHLMRQVYREWHGMWWEVRKEWRLMVRAECHHRYVVWSKVFEAWRLYVLYQKATAEKLELATAISNKAILCRSLKHWKNFVNMQRGKKKIKSEADSHYHQVLTRFVWIKWKEQYRLQQERQEMEVVALQFWAYRIQAQHWLIWSDKLKNKRQIYHRHALSLRHYQQTVKRKCFLAWTRYWLQKRDRKRQKDYADKYYGQSLRYQTFYTWMKQYQLQQSIKSHQHHIEVLAARFQRRRFFQIWKHYMMIQENKREKMYKAEIHYRKKLMLLGFNAFRLNVVQLRVKEMRNELAIQHYFKTLLNRHWQIWLQKCENNEELQISHLTKQAHTHYQSVLKRKCWNALVLYTRYREQRKTQKVQADAFFFVHSMPRFVFQWRIYVEMEKIKRENQEKYTSFRRENLIARFFYQWYNSYEEHREFRMNWRMAVLHHEDSMRKHFLSRWRSRLQSCLQERDKESLAENHYHSSICRKHLLAWVQYVRDLRKMETLETKAVTHHYKSSLKRVLQTWIEYTKEIKQEKSQWLRATKFYQMKLCKKVVSAWNAQRIQGRQFQILAEERYRHKCNVCKRWAFKTWRDNVQENLRDRQEDKAAIIHYNRQLLHKLLLTWHRYAAIHAYKKSETRQWVESTKQALDRNKLQRYFWQWQKARDERILQKFKHEQAVNHHDTVIQQRALFQWKEFTVTAVKKNLLMKQCVWFHNIRLMSNFLSLWKWRYQLRQEENQKTDIALWHWSLVLQKKILVVWFGYTADRKRKKERITQALERRRTRQIRQGVTQWIAVATDLSNMRAKIAAQQNAKDAFAKHQLVQRCALHWRYITAKRNTRGDHSNRKKQDLLQFEKKNVDYIPKLKPKDLQKQEVMCKPFPNFPLESRSPQRLPDNEQTVSSVRLPGRRKPRHPSFLEESLKRAGLFSEESKLSHPASKMLEERKHIHSVRVMSEEGKSSHPAHVQAHASLFVPTSDLPGPEDLSIVPPCDNSQIPPLDIHGVGSLPYIQENTHIYQEHISVLSSAAEVTQHHVQLDHVQSIRPRAGGEFQLLTPDHFLSHPDYVLPTFQSDVSPLSTPRTVDSTSLAVRSMIQTIDSTAGIPEAPSRVNDQQTIPLSEQIVRIRNQLKSFEQQKRKLRKLQKQHKQLSSWLDDEEGTVSESEIMEVKEEVREMEKEIKTLQAEIERQKPECAQLVEKVNQLIQVMSERSSSSF
ncbi:protein SFI1 homolog [Saccostrea echinata]|uniref:protein SFI1 homolog n=1 Tax=Saccostrea echinata TaxID=191078 RepID=UPI002A802E97|nr:protein SFI1 homolog [Saccostrea echinata]